MSFQVPMKVFVMVRPGWQTGEKACKGLRAGPTTFEVLVTLRADSHLGEISHAHLAFCPLRERTDRPCCEYTDLSVNDFQSPKL